MSSSNYVDFSLDNYEAITEMIQGCFGVQKIEGNSGLLKSKNELMYNLFFVLFFNLFF